MIVDVFVNLFFGIVNTILQPLSSLGNIVVNSSMFLPIVSILKIIFYVLPIQQLLPLIALTVALMGFRIVVSLLKTVWDILPIL